jgi:hypothetical protein
MERARERERERERMDGSGIGLSGLQRAQRSHTHTFPPRHWRVESHQALTRPQRTGWGRQKINRACPLLAPRLTPRYLCRCPMDVDGCGGWANPRLHGHHTSFFCPPSVYDMCLLQDPKVPNKRLVLPAITHIVRMQEMPKVNHLPCRKHPHAPTHTQTHYLRRLRTHVPLSIENAVSTTFSRALFNPPTPIRRACLQQTQGFHPITQTNAEHTRTHRQHKSDIYKIEFHRPRILRSVVIRQEHTYRRRVENAPVACECVRLKSISALL